MVKQGVEFTFAPELIKEHIIYSRGRWFEEVDNIHHADIDGDRRWAVLELQGIVDDVERGIAWVTGKGIAIDPVTGGIVKG